MRDLAGAEKSRDPAENSRISSRIPDPERDAEFQAEKPRHPEPARGTHPGPPRNPEKKRKPYINPEKIIYAAEIQQQASRVYIRGSRIYIWQSSDSDPVVPTPKQKPRENPETQKPSEIYRD